MTAIVALNRLFPPEVSAAAETLSAARADLHGASSLRLHSICFYLWVMFSGCALGNVLLITLIVTPSDKDFWRASLTAISVLSGFMIATMLFTGKIEVAKSLSLSELRDVARKSNYLLLYQFGTLINHFACLLLMLVVPAIQSRWPLIGPSMMVITCGLFAISLTRSLLIPIQIIELHRLTHAALLREKRDEAATRTDF